MSKKQSYNRLYCANCKIIYSVIKNIGLKKCRTCGKQLTLKSFNPYISLFSGIFILLIATASVVFSTSPIMWIGGFILGGGLCINGFEKWDKIRDLDKFS